MTSSVDIIEAYNENGNLSYFSTEDIIYRFNSAKYSAKIAVSVGGGTTSVYNVDTSLENEYVKVYEDTRTKIVTVVLTKPALDLSSGKYGNYVDFRLQLFSNIENDTLEKVLYFEIYNVVPIINLWGVNNESENDLFS